MNTSLRHAVTSLFAAIASCVCAAPALAQGAAGAPAAPAARAAAPAPGYGGNAMAPKKDGRAAHRASEEQLLGAPQEYGSPTDLPRRNTVDAQQAALLDEQRMSMTATGPGGQPAPLKGQRNKAPLAAANGKARGAAQARPNANDAMLPAAAAKTTYADPYDLTGTGKRGVYRSPW
ncbi:hypothetical protein [Paraburkholderia lacunae]|uniref:Uncharacterized protein n=1 Tax=Paraburkholderia lacunae TaxID=2211104 RepID=A0A370MZ33_9BURK|nr:hypothetical protein [Paraburkholderia lacunae]RDJ98643.1 hypothetical protein DLM46_32750 [Paraburkholderia lacunae]